MAVMVMWVASGAVAEIYVWMDESRLRQYSDDRSQSSQKSYQIGDEGLLSNANLVQGASKKNKINLRENPVSEAVLAQNSASVRRDFADPKCEIHRKDIAYFQNRLASSRGSEANKVHMEKQLRLLKEKQRKDRCPVY